MLQSRTGVCREKQRQKESAGKNKSASNSKQMSCRPRGPLTTECERRHDESARNINLTRHPSKSTHGSFLVVYLRGCGGCAGLVLLWHDVDIASRNK
jgi:hypothetical protein